MTRICDILAVLEDIAPNRFAFSFDHVGLQIGDLQATVTRAAVSLDRSFAATQFAAEHNCQLLLSHHPLIWESLVSVTPDTHVGKTVTNLVRNEITFIAAHTNWDCARGGINDTLALRLGLEEVRAFGSSARTKHLKLAVFTPAESVDAVIDAASGAGAGVIGLYRRCAFHQPGTGTFLGQEGSSPTVGQPGQVENVEETKIEMTLPTSLRTAVATAVRKAHPYEEPAIDFIELAEQKEHPLCRIGKLPRASTLAEFAASVDSRLGAKCWTWGDPKRQIERVAVCGGAADEEWQLAKVEGADVFVTGEVRQHIGLEASESELAIIAAGHFATEHPGCIALVEAMSNKLPSVEWLAFEPSPGQAGRPF